MKSAPLASLVLVTSGIVACNDSVEAASVPSPIETPSLRFIDESGAAVSSIYYRDLVSVEVRGMKAGDRVEIAASMPPWASSATFVVGPGGVIDSSKNAPLEGSYEGADPDGFFWSMNTTKLVNAASADVHFTVSKEGKEILSADLARTFEFPGLQRVVPDDPSIVGKLFLPPGGPHPVVIAFGGSEGGLTGGFGYAEELLPEGYAVLALAYFGEKGLPPSLENIPLEYFDKAITWLRKRPEVRPDRIGMIGGSRGGELALLLSSKHPEIRAVVADAPSAYVWGSASGKGAGWTVAGSPVPRVISHGGTPDEVKAPDGTTAYAFTPMFEYNLAKASTSERDLARIPVENATASIALFGGADDQLWPSCSFMQTVMDRLKTSGHSTSHADESTCFDAAGHNVISLGFPTTWATFSPMGNITLALGGTPAGMAKAARARQAKVRAFFAKTLDAP